MMVAVSEPSYLLNGIPTALRRALSQRAAADDTSLADTIRAALCFHYGLNCPPRGRGYNPTRDDGSEQMVLRISEQLLVCIKADSETSGETMRTLILNILHEDLLPLEVSA
jgi:hypothetical protein